MAVAGSYFGGSWCICGLEGEQNRTTFSYFLTASIIIERRVNNLNLDLSISSRQDLRVICMKYM